MAVMTVLDLNNVTQAIGHYSAIEAMVGGKILVSPQTALSSFQTEKGCVRAGIWRGTFSNAAKSCGFFGGEAGVTSLFSATRRAYGCGP